jgi:hypothetical protein
MTFQRIRLVAAWLVASLLGALLALSWRPPVAAAQPFVREPIPVAASYEALTVSSSAVGLQSATLSPAGGDVWICQISVEGASLRWRYDGSNPTTTEGHLAQVGDWIELKGFTNLQRFRAIRTGTTDATLRVTCGR